VEELLVVQLDGRLEDVLSSKRDADARPERPMEVSGKETLDRLRDVA